MAEGPSSARSGLLGTPLKAAGHDDIVHFCKVAKAPGIFSYAVPNHDIQLTKWQKLMSMFWLSTISVVACRFCLATVMALAALSAFGREAAYCATTRALTKHEGEYARKDIWEKLKTARNWEAMNDVVSHNGHLISITVSASGSIMGASNHWHEGANACIKFRGNELWATAIPWSDDQEEPPDLKNAVWLGPFIRIGAAVSPEALYFHRIFGNKCFLSNIGRSWCFGPGYIEVDQITHTSELILDLNEMPRDGFPVRATDKNDAQKKYLWLFRRKGNGWEVFDEKFKFEDRLADELIRKPWEILKPFAN